MIPTPTAAASSRAGLGAQPPPRRHQRRKVQTHDVHQYPTKRRRDRGGTPSWRGTAGVAPGRGRERTGTRCRAATPRRLIEKGFSVDDLRSARDPSDAARAVSSVADLSFGEYLRLLEKPENWDKLGLPLDRSVFIKNLDRVRTIRNGVMHFDPDGIDDDELADLRQAGQFLDAVLKLRAASTKA